MNRDCSREELEALVRGQLSSETAERVRAHALACSQCKNELLWLRTEADLLARRREKGARTPRALWGSIEERIARRPSGWSRLEVLRMRPMWMMAAALVVLVPVAAHVVARLSSTRIGLGGLKVSMTRDEGEAGPEGVTRTRARGPVTLVLKAAAAEIKVEAGAPDEVVLRLSGTRQRAELVARGEDRIEVVFSGGERLKKGAARLSLPKGSHLDLETVSGEIAVPEGFGDVKLRTVSGDVSVAGSLRIDAGTGSGEVAVRQPGGPVQVKTVSGDVEMEARAGAPAQLSFESTSGSLGFSGQCATGCILHLRTVSGDASLKLAEGSSLGLRFQSLSGNLEDGLGLEALSREAAPGGTVIKGRLLQGAGRIDFQSTSGDLGLTR